MTFLSVQDTLKSDLLVNKTNKFYGIVTLFLQVSNM